MKRYVIFVVVFTLLFTACDRQESGKIKVTQLAELMGFEEVSGIRLRVSGKGSYTFNESEIQSFLSSFGDVELQYVDRDYDDTTTGWAMMLEFTYNSGNPKTINIEYVEQYDIRYGSDHFYDNSDDIGLKPYLDSLTDKKLSQ